MRRHITPHVILLSIMFSQNVVLATSSETVQNSQTEGKTFNDVQLNEQAVNNHCRKLYENIKTAKPREVSDQLHPAANWYAMYGNHPDIELTTGIKKKWYLKTAEYMSAIATFSGRIDDIYANQDKVYLEELKLLLTKREKILNTLDELIEARKRFKLSPGELKDLRRKHQRAERAKRKRQKNPQRK